MERAFLTIHDKCGDTYCDHLEAELMNCMRQYDESLKFVTFSHSKVYTVYNMNKYLDHMVQELICTILLQVVCSK